MIDEPAVRIGDRVLRTEDHALLTGRGRYVDDLRPGPHGERLHAAFVRSPVAHAGFSGIGVRAATAAPGVVGVFTAAHLAMAPLRGHHMLPSVFDRPPLAESLVRFAGEPVAVIVAATRAQAVDACDLVEVDYEPCDPIVDPFSALGERALLLFPDHGSNVAFERLVGDEAATLQDAPRVIRVRMHNQRVASAPMEPDGAVAQFVDGMLTVWASTQRVHQVRDAIATSLGLHVDCVRVVAPQVGGGFGGKFEPSPETIVVAALSHRLGATVAWVQSRTDNLMTMPHGRGQAQDVALAVDDDGTLLALYADVVSDAGAFPMVGALVPNATLSMLPGPYRWQRVGGRCRAAATNTTPVGAYRGAGRPEATAAVERAVDLAAITIGIDPLDLRRRNLIGSAEFPYTSATGMVYDSGDYLRCLDAAAASIGYDDLRAEQRERRRRADPSEPHLGIGLAVWLDCTPMNRPGELAIVTVEPDERASDGYVVTVRDGANDQGQAHQTTWAIILAEALHVPVAHVQLHGGDTAAVAHGEGTGSARSLQLAGNAVAQAGHQVVDAARAVAADLLEAALDDIELAVDGRFAVRGSPSRSVGWREIAQHGALLAEVDFVQPGPTYPSGVHAAVVEIDADTGAVALRRFVAVDDCGTVVNPVAVEGQQHGGIAQGIAQALFEQIVHDNSGTPLTTNLTDYLVPSAAELCSLEVSTIGLRSPVNPIGAKGIGQAGAIGSTPAVQNAVVDALAHLGVRHIDLPLTPERVWRAIVSARE